MYSGSFSNIYYLFFLDIFFLKIVGYHMKHILDYLKKSIAYVVYKHPKSIIIIIK